MKSLHRIVNEGRVCAVALLFGSSRAQLTSKTMCCFMYSDDFVLHRLAKIAMKYSL